MLWISALHSRSWSIASNPSDVQRIHWFLHRLLTSPISRSTGFKIHGISNPSTAYTADRNLLEDLDGTEYEDTVAHIQTY